MLAVPSNHMKNKKSPLIRRPKDAKYVVPPFFISFSQN
ncbi:hypothetical protein B834_2231 [Enterococcus mundtii 1A]|nr:hypothetical protein [Enterococcus mundtii 1A]